MTQINKIDIDTIHITPPPQRIAANRRHPGLALMAAASLLLAACSTPGTKHESKDAVAASSNAVAEASSSGAPELAPLEIGTAQDKLARANQALASRDYKKAKILADEALADAQAAQTKTNSIKAQQAAAALQDDIRVLREELNRATE
ncbi:MAG TPA: DUF4398 domain-containing protein [Burkholderiaceae bacterium]|nr:DUF4398 domain-containing protein [Burkholderiaceae bacterium]